MATDCAAVAAVAAVAAASLTALHTDRVSYIQTSLCSASPLGCQHGTARIRC